MLKKLVIVIGLFNMGCGSKEENRWEDEYTDAYKSYEKIIDSINLSPRNKETKPTDNGSSCQVSVDLNYDDGCNTCTCDAGQWSCTELDCSEKPLPNPRDMCSEQDAAIQEQNLATISKMNAEAKTIALNQKAESLELKALQPSLSLGSRNLVSSDKIKPDIDPFPNSVIAFGEPHDIRTEGYQLSNRSTLESFRAYETEPGSNKFFIVDYIEDAAHQADYGRTPYQKELTIDPSSSFSNWHSSLSNDLALPSFYPRLQIQQEIYNCGCEENEYYSFYSEARRPNEQPLVAIYMLPGSEKPTFDIATIFEVEYQYIYQDTSCARKID